MTPDPDPDLERELDAHRAEHAGDLAAAGLPQAAARRGATLAFGAHDAAAEACRDQRRGRRWRDLRQDVAYALRRWRRQPGFAVTALLTLALGIGGATLMFTLVDYVLFRPLDYPQAARLLQLQEQTNYSTHWGNLWAATYPNYQDIAASARGCNAAAWSYNGGIVQRPGQPGWADAYYVTPGFLAVFGVAPALGRDFNAGDNHPGAAPVAVLSYNAWQQRFGGRASALNQLVDFEGQAYAVVGVAPRGFQLPDDPGDLFLPIGAVTQPWLSNRGAHRLQAAIRLAPGATTAGVQAELATLAHRLQQQYPATNQGRSFRLDPLRLDTSQVSGSLWLLFAAVGALLLLACVNIASLLLAQAVSREHEWAMRAALGAGRGRLARQCLAEGALLAAAGGALGIVAAALALRPFITAWPGDLPRAGDIHLDAPVLVFALALALACGLLVSLAPAWRASKLAGLRSSARAGRASRRLHTAFVAAEVALALVLLVAAGTLLRTITALAAQPTGIDINNLLTARTALAPGVLASPGRIRSAWPAIEARLRAVPGVASASYLDTVPLREGSNVIGYRLSAAPVPGDQQPLVSAICVAPSYFSVAPLHLIQGRALTADDTMGHPEAVVIDADMARQAFPGRDPIGQHLWIGLGPDPATVVGVVQHVRAWGAADDQPGQVRAQLYYAFAQVPDNLLARWSQLMSVVVRTNVPPGALLPQLQAAVAGAQGNQVLYEIRTMDALLASSLAQQRFLALIVGVFAMLALLLASLGVYGVLAFLTARRTAEIGVRMALGAGRAQVVGMVLAQSAAMVALGLAGGAAGAWFCSGWIVRAVTGAVPPPPLLLVGLPLALAAAALAASYGPARRASRIDPVRALRAE